MPKGIYKRLIGKKSNHWKGGKPKCIDCGKELSGYGEFKKNQRTGKYFKKQNRCRKCFLKWQKLHPINKGKKFSEEVRKRMSKSKMGMLTGDKNPSKRLDVRKKISKALKGRKCPWMEGSRNHGWNNGSSFEPYSMDWTETLRRSIRERDHYICQLCGKPQGDIAHDVHHQDYNKKNCNSDNLITLCHSCNSKVNKNRDYWTKYFQSRKINIKKKICLQQ